MKHSAVTLDDKYAVEVDRVYLTGTQAIVRLPLLQRALDRAAGLNTAGFISGYRGSPLGTVDIQLWQARSHLQEQNIVFQPGVNEEAGATAIWGTQQVTLFPGAKHDGVFAFWYGKGPGVDRCGDVFRHANFAGTSPHGGVLLIAGDDPACKSSTVPSQSEFALAASLIPVLAPASVQDILELGLHGWALSRYCGLYVGFKVVADTVDSSASVSFGLERFAVRYPNGDRRAPGGPGIRWPDAPLEQEHRINTVGIPALHAYVRENALDRVVLENPSARIGIITAGKALQDVRQALADLGLPGRQGAEAGLRVLKLALTWPVEPRTIIDFAGDLDEIIVVEEKQPLIEDQVKKILYDQSTRPRVLGKRDVDGSVLFKADGEFSAAEVALALARRVRRIHDTPAMRARLAALEEQAHRLPKLDVGVERRPYFCSGCPHNTSTKVIDGSRALAGIGCHYMAQSMDRNTATFSQMGGEGMAWIGQAPFTEERHVFANIGDGTYNHSGSMAIRAAVASGVNITYKLLFNDAVAMTGGQPVEGAPDVPQITRQLASMGVRRVVVVTDEPEKYDGVTDLAPGTDVRHRRLLQETERELREIPGCTAIVYDQTCASEKRRRRKRGKMADPAKRAFINARVCEACGDCSRTSNCLSVVPIETEYGVKRAIDQSTCNKDFSCVEGFCPSFVTVHGGQVRKPARVQEQDFVLPEPRLPGLDRAFNMLVAGVGGTGVVTIGALLGVAAHAEGKHVTVLDQMGMAQKGGAVWSHIKIAATEEELKALRVTQAGANLLLACDLVVGAGREALSAVSRGTTWAVVNTHETITADFVLHPGTRLPVRRMRAAIAEAVGADAADMLDATALATALIGDSIATNLFLLGYAWQRGLVPIGEAALIEAIELNGTAVEANKAAFRWGRRAAAEPARVAEIAGAGKTAPKPQDLDGLIETRVADLTDYQNRAYARRYRDLVATVRAREVEALPGSTALTDAVARYYHKLLAYKDEYEVARLYAAPAFRESLLRNFAGDYRLEFHLAPPIMAKRDPRTGHLQKRAFGGWMLPAFRVLAKLRWLRGTRLDPFGRTEERQAERRLIHDYEALIGEIFGSLTAENLPLATALASIPARITGFGHIKERRMREAAMEQSRLLARFRQPPQLMAAE